MRKRQAAPDYVKAEAMGVSSFIPKNIRLDAREACVWSDWIGPDEGRDVCARFATHEVTVTDGTGETTTELLCERHAGDAQVEYEGTVTIKRRKRG